ncbi:RipA family octameric membrane protein [Candidatus Poriferisodalis sp.]|uniref:RipA family octameric membrane protein n=1 Tax=Candidatus Poriferisodalis sp. TaxID=3101277 RepID=UPI003B01BE38
MSTLITQYGLYVESAEKVSHRRGMANNFFLLVNSVVSVALAAFGLSIEKAALLPLFFSAAIMLSVCALWGFTVHSYRQLNSAKWKIVNALRRVYIGLGEHAVGPSSSIGWVETK